MEVGIIIFLAAWFYIDVYYWHVWSSRPTQDAPDLGESVASDSESNPAPKWVI